MAIGVEMITVDSLDPDRLAAWWATATGGELTALMPGEFVYVTLAGGLRLGFQRVEDPTVGKNRVHVDFHTQDLEAEVIRLVSLGATETGRHDFGPEFQWVVFADPDGNAFCVAASS